MVPHPAERLNVSELFALPNVGAFRFCFQVLLIGLTRGSLHCAAQSAETMVPLVWTLTLTWVGNPITAKSIRPCCPGFWATCVVKMAVMVPGLRMTGIVGGIGDAPRVSEAVVVSIGAGGADGTTR